MTLSESVDNLIKSLKIPKQKCPNCGSTSSYYELPVIDDNSTLFNNEPFTHICILCGWRQHGAQT